jgi:hypothetical protein
MFVGVYPEHSLRLSDEFYKDDEYGKILDGCSLITPFRLLFASFSVRSQPDFC